MKVLLQFLRHFYRSALRKDKRDWEIISYCIMVSGLFWVLNAMGKVYHHTLTVPVEYQYNQKLYVPVASLPDFVEVKAEGRGWDMLKAIWAKNPSVLRVPINKPLTTLNLYPKEWQPQIHEMMPSVKLERVLGDSIFCRFDPVESRDIPLMADLKDFSVKAGYRISSPVSFTPPVVRFTGAASLVRSLPPHLPVKISGTNVQESVDQNVNLDFQADYPRNELLSYDPEVANVHFSIRPALEDEMEVPVQLIHQENLPGLFLKENKVTILYLVSLPDREKIQAKDFRLVADASSFNPADSTVELQLKKWPALVSDAHPGSKKIRVYGR